MRRRAAHTTAAVVTVLLLTAATGGVPAGRFPAAPTSVAACVVPPATPTASGDLAAVADRHEPTRLRYPTTAGPVLRDLAAQMTTAPCDHVHGRFNHVWFRQWGFSGRVQEILRWFDQDGSGAALATRYPPERTAVNRQWWRPGQHLYDTFGWPVPRIDTYRDADLLRHAMNITSQSADNDPAEAVLGLIDLASWHSPYETGRHTALTILADLPHLTAYPAVADRAGRVGVGVAAVDTDGYRYLLILHPATGEALAYEISHLRAGAWQVVTYALFLAHTRTDNRWWEPTTDDERQRWDPTHPPPAEMVPQRRRSWIEYPPPLCVPSSEGETP
ncbi:hypothetical protein [Micromonospora carbonacea]|uniref:CU044_5270 family protein n=1 Tax=Micromonospora carbonacea TaxID=47853 RepID=A0A1C4V544_9ACTN|nr:hypothetical protein [Micromonospora carbonacea]SCE79084.1 hypothetical protein GA0070563_10239 [Micromonospora carbonacea]